MTKVIPFDAKVAAARRIDVAGDRAAAVMARLDKPMPQPRVPVFLRSIPSRSVDRRRPPCSPASRRRCCPVASTGARWRMHSPGAGTTSAQRAYRRNMQRLIGGGA